MAKIAVSVEKMEQKQKITIGIDKSNEQILALESDERLELEWDPRDFRPLPEEVTRSFRRENLKKYWVAEAQANEMKREAHKGFEIIDNPLGNSLSAYEYRQHIRARKGWHGYWANPGADFDRCMATGNYVQVRKPTDEQERKGYVPGEENGEVIKRLNAEMKVEAIALECREEHYQQYLQWMDQQSSMRYGEIKSNYFEKIDDLNKDIKVRGGRIIPQDLNEEGAARQP